MSELTLSERLRAEASFTDGAIKVTRRNSSKKLDAISAEIELGMNRWWHDRGAMMREAADRIEALEAALCEERETVTRLAELNNKLGGGPTYKGYEIPYMQRLHPKEPL